MEITFGATDLRVRALTDSNEYGKRTVHPHDSTFRMGRGKDLHNFVSGVMYQETIQTLGTLRNPPQTGNVRLVIDFAAATTHNITVLVWSEHENVFEVNELGGVKYNIDH